MRTWIIALAATAFSCGESASEPVPCPAGKAACGEACVELATDASHCGACGRSCASGLGCFAGACTSPASLPQPRAGHGAATLADGRIVIVGGSRTMDQLPQYLTAVQAYDPTLNAWTELEELPTPRAYAGVGVSHGELLVAGGLVVVQEASVFLATAQDIVELYDPASDSWSLASDLVEPRSDAPVVETSDGRAFAVWGWKDQADGSSTLHDSFELREPDGTWALNETTAHPPRWGARAVVGKDDQIFVLGGFGVPPPAFPWNPTRKTVVYDRPSDTWTELSESHVAHGLGAATIGMNGLIYYIGGIDESMKTHNEVEAYDPVSNSWSFVAPLPLTLQDSAAATGTDGRIYVMGGVPTLETPTPIDVMYVYDPKLDQWFQ